MYKQMKQTCLKTITKIYSRLQQLKYFTKTKLQQNVLDKIVMHIINDFKFLSDDLNLILEHMSMVQNQCHEKNLIISHLEKEILNKSAEKKIVEQMMKTKLEKLNKQYKFLEFTGKNSQGRKFTHQKSKSDFIIKGLGQLEKDIKQSNQRACNKVKKLKNQIQNEQQRYLTLENNNHTKNFIDQLDISNITLSKRYQASPSRSNTKRQKLLQFDVQNGIGLYKTKKKSLLQKDKASSNFDLGRLKIEEQSDQISKKVQKQSKKDQETKTRSNSAENKVLTTINKNKKQQLAQLIAQQNKIVMVKQKYFSTDI